LKGKIITIAIAFLVCGGIFVSAQQASDGRGVLQKGLTEFQNARYGDALHEFQGIILNPSYTAVQGDAYFWISLSYMALGRLDDAEKNLEFFLLNFPENANVPEATYQKGRLLYLQGEYNKAIQVLYAFIQSYKDNPFAGNAYYWIGESLYSLGHFDEAKKVFQAVVQDYPTSFKVEAAQYKVSLINLQNRESQLLRLLKWSHEEALQAQQEYQVRERAYQQALIAYQRKIAELARSQQTSSGSPGSTQGSGTASQDRIATLNQEVAQLQDEIKTLIDQLQSSNRQ